MLGMDIQFNIISYAVISAKFANSNNLFESFLPLVEHALLCVNNDYISEVSINDAYEEIYGYRIHSAILAQILKVLEQHGKIERLKHEHIQINKTKLKTYDTKELYEMNLRALISEIDFFTKKKGQAFKREEIYKAIIDFLKKNAIDFNSFIDYKFNFEDSNNDNPIFPFLIEFFIEERRNNTKNYEFIKEIYAGIVLSSIIVLDEDIAPSFKEDFKIENVLLDSNYIFRLLDLQTSLEYQAAQDTYHALKDINCRFWVCRETLKQIADTIHAIILNYSESANAILKINCEERFTGLASACIRRSLTAAKLESIIDDLEDTLLNDYDVEIIDNSKFNIDLIDNKNDDYEQLLSIKGDASNFGILHDLLLIHIVKENRPKYIYKAEQANWWVLTDDNKLTRWNSQNKHSQKIAECITESQLATVMWLCNPKMTTIDGLFNTIIALKSQGLAGNSEYIKISKEIEIQKERYANDEKKLKRLSLVFSQRLISIEDMLTNERDELDVKFDLLLAESHRELEEKNRIIEENQVLISEQNQKTKNLSTEFQHTTFLLSEKSRKYVETLKKLAGEKQDKYDRVNSDIQEFQDKKGNRNKFVSIILRIIVVVLILILFIKVLPLIQGLEEWYSKNQLLYDVCSKIFMIIVIFLGWKNKSIINIFNKIARGIVWCLIKLKLLKDFDAIIKNLESEKEIFSQEILKIQDEIDKALE